MGKRIFMCGPSGSGKTTMAMELSVKHELGKFISGSSKGLWEKHGIYRHQDIIRKSFLDPSWGYKFQIELLETREKIFAAQGNSNIITDRSPLDNIIYFALQNSALCDYESNYEYNERALNMFKPGDVLIFRYFLGDLTDIPKDYMRITNPIYQHMVQTLMARELPAMGELGVKIYHLPFRKNMDITREAENMAKLIKEVWAKKL